MRGLCRPLDQVKDYEKVSIRVSDPPDWPTASQNVFSEHAIPSRKPVVSFGLAVITDRVPFHASIKTLLLAYRPFRYCPTAAQSFELMHATPLRMLEYLPLFPLDPIDQ
jgi:hypothetical protein